VRPLGGAVGSVPVRSTPGADRRGSADFGLCRLSVQSWTRREQERTADRGSALSPQRGSDSPITGRYSGDAPRRAVDTFDDLSMALRAVRATFNTLTAECPTQGADPRQRRFHSLSSSFRPGNECHYRLWAADKRKTSVANWHRIQGFKSDLCFSGKTKSKSAVHCGSHHQPNHARTSKSHERISGSWIV